MILLTVGSLQYFLVLHITGMDFLAPLRHFRRRGISVNVDNIVFKANYRGMVFILILMAVLVTARQFIGKPISCHLFSDISHRPVANDVSKCVVMADCNYRLSSLAFGNCLLVAWNLHNSCQ